MEKLGKPSIEKINHEKGYDHIFCFRISNIDVSIANAIRRIILNNIPTVAFKGFPHKETQIHIIENTSRFNNEIIKQRFINIPIYLDVSKVNVDDFEFHIQKENKEDKLIWVTTEDFQIFSISKNEYISKDEVKKIFPPDKLTNQYIDIIRLRPKISDSILGEKINLKAKASILTAKDDCSYIVASTCCFFNTKDNVVIDQKWKEKEKELKEKQKNDPSIDIDYEKSDFMALDAYRNFIENSFDFSIETVGYYSNESLVTKSLELFIEQLKTVFQHLSENTQFIKEYSGNQYDIIIDYEEFTCGKALERHIFKMLYPNEISFCGFKKEHPSDSHAIIRLIFNEKTDKTIVLNHIDTVIHEIKKQVEIIKDNELFIE